MRGSEDTRISFPNVFAAAVETTRSLGLRSILVSPFHLLLVPGRNRYHTHPTHRDRENAYADTHILQRSAAQVSFQRSRALSNHRLLAPLS